MIEQIPYQVWHCTACDLVWLNRTKRVGKPKRCPNRKCRKTATWRGTKKIESTGGGSNESPVAWAKSLMPKHQQGCPCNLCKLKK